jgi:tight adherence protein B
MAASLVLIIHQSKLHHKRNEKKDRKTEPSTQACSDYSRYSYSMPERIRYTLIASAVLFAIGYIFFRSIIFCCILAAFSPIYLKFKRKNLIKKRLQKLTVLQD